LKLNLVGETEERKFIELFGRVLHTRNILETFDEFDGKDNLSDADLQDYMSYYSGLYSKYIKKQDKEDVSQDVEFRMEFVKQLVVNIDYILARISDYCKSNRDKEIKADIIRHISANLELYPKRELIEEFLSRVNTDSDIPCEWVKYIAIKRKAAIDTLEAKYNLNTAKYPDIIKRLLNSQEGYNLTVSDIDAMLPPMQLFGAKPEDSETKLITAENLEKELRDLYLIYGV
jgi:type I restriction enzyme R subunit